ncbi:hypothetical protein LZ30DRAFT_321427 [Colletotrichum cereale]|nr:hypothetical protein LZ30DRAFT_321427 [Colletotrichum cereale]
MRGLADSSLGSPCQNMHGVTPASLGHGVVDAAVDNGQDRPGQAQARPVRYAAANPCPTDIPGEGGLCLALLALILNYKTWNLHCRGCRNNYTTTSVPAAGWVGILCSVVHIEVHSIRAEKPLNGRGNTWTACEMEGPGATGLDGRRASMTAPAMFGRSRRG